MLSHESAGALWDICKGGTRPIHVSVPVERRIRLEGIRVHRRNPMPAATTKCSILLSQPLFTLVDLAGTLETDLLEAAINDADRLNLIDPETLEAGLGAVPQFRGRGKLRRALARYTRTDSTRICRSASLPARSPPCCDR
jgi:hypothetical protein